MRYKLWHKCLKLLPYFYLDIYQLKYQLYLSSDPVFVYRDVIYFVENHISNLVSK